MKIFVSGLGIDLEFGNETNKLLSDPTNSLTRFGFYRQDFFGILIDLALRLFVVLLEVVSQFIGF